MTDPLLIEDFQLVKQVCTAVTVKFVDASVADFFDRMVDEGVHPSRFSRVWLHTHPGADPNPSSVDERTFERVFAKTDWSVMFILARAGLSYARLAFRVGPGGQWRIPVEVDFSQPFDAADQRRWNEEYDAAVQVDFVDCLEQQNRVETFFLDADPFDSEWDKEIDDGGFWI